MKLVVSTMPERHVRKKESSDYLARKLKELLLDVSDLKPNEAKQVADYWANRTYIGKDVNIKTK